mgnify:CR=1 FL=1
MKCNVSFFPVIIGIYNPKIKSNAEPEIPGNIIADIAIIPAINTYNANPGFKFVMSILAPLPVCELKYVIADTTAIPMRVNIRFFYFPFMSSLTINGIVNIINPINNALTWYMCVSNKLDNISDAIAIPITQPIPNFTENLIASFLSPFLLINVFNEFINLS